MNRKQLQAKADWWHKEADDATLTAVILGGGFDLVRYCERQARWYADLARAGRAERNAMLRAEIKK